MEESPCPVCNAATSALGNPPQHRISPLFPLEFLQSLSLLLAAAFFTLHIRDLTTQIILKILCHPHLPHLDSNFLTFSCQTQSTSISSLLFCPFSTLPLLGSSCNELLVLQRPNAPVSSRTLLDCLCFPLTLSRGQ